MNKDALCPNISTDGVVACIECTDDAGLMAHLSDGTMLQSDRADRLAEQLWEAGLRVESITALRWEDSVAAPGTQQMIVIRSYLIWRASGKSHEEAAGRWANLYGDEDGRV